VIPLLFLLLITVNQGLVLQTTPRPPNVGVLQFGNTRTGKLVRQRIEQALRETDSWRVIDSDLLRTAAKGAGYSGSLNMSLEEARNLGSALGCDYYIINEADTVARSPSTGDTYYEAYAVIFVVSARTGKLIKWARPAFRSSTKDSAEELLLSNLASETSRNSLLADLRNSEEDAVRSRDIASRTVPAIMEEAPSDDQLAAEQGLRLPRPFRRLLPPYPESAAQAEAQGIVDVLVDLDARGEVTQVEVARWAGFGLDQATVDTVRQLHFFPATRHGTAIPIRVLLRYNFRKPSQ